MRSKDELSELFRSKMKLAQSIRQLPNDIQVSLWEKVLQSKLNEYSSQKLNIPDLYTAPVNRGTQLGFLSEPYDYIEFQYDDKTYRIIIRYDDENNQDVNTIQFGQYHQRNNSFLRLISFNPKQPYILSDGTHVIRSIFDVGPIGSRFTLAFLYMMITIVRRFCPYVEPMNTFVYYNITTAGAYSFTRRTDSLEDFVKFLRKRDAQSQTQSNGGMSSKTHVKFDHRKYKVHTDKNKGRYINAKKEKVYLSSIKGKYRYC